jgi:hypothetical protein
MKDRETSAMISTELLPINRPPRYVRRILAEACRRWHSLTVTERPGLDGPTSAMGAFRPGDLAELALAGYWPLPASLIRRLRTVPRPRLLPCVATGPDIAGDAARATG